MKLKKAMPKQPQVSAGKQIENGAYVVANCEQNQESRVLTRNDLWRDIVTSTTVDAVGRSWEGRKHSSSSSDSNNVANHVAHNVGNNVVNNNHAAGTLSDSSGSSSSSSSSNSDGGSSGSSSSGSGSDDDSASDSGSSSDGSGDENDKVADIVRKSFMKKPSVEFKTKLPAIETDLNVGQPTLIRIPNFMPFESNGYEDHKYKNTITQDDLKNNESRQAFITKLKTTVRWRRILNKSNRSTGCESNAHIVHWSDGSQTFHVGAEAFDVVSHPLPGNQNQFYLCLGNYYRQNSLITEKLTLRPKLESNFGLNHVQGMRNRALGNTVTNHVKILTDITANPVIDRGRKAKEELDKARKQKTQQRHQQSLHNPYTKPMTQQPNVPRGFSNSGIRTNRNTQVINNKEEGEVGSSDSDL